MINNSIYKINNIWVSFKWLCGHVIYNLINFKRLKTKYQKTIQFILFYDSTYKSYNTYYSIIIL